MDRIRVGDGLLRGFAFNGRGLGIDRFRLSRRGIGSGRRRGRFFGLRRSRFDIFGRFLDDFSATADNRGLDARLFDLLGLFAEQGFFDLRNGIIVQRAHMALHGDADLTHLVDQDFVGHVQISGKFIYPDLRHSFPLS